MMRRITPRRPRTPRTPPRIIGARRLALLKPVDSGCFPAVSVPVCRDADVVEDVEDVRDVVVGIVGTTWF